MEAYLMAVMKVIEMANSNVAIKINMKKEIFNNVMKIKLIEEMKNVNEIISILEKWRTMSKKVNLANAMAVMTVNMKAW